jgi:ubiquinone/menaquinone biosynthesis C-methylase UbiE
MSDIFWSGQLSPAMKILVNANCVLAWLLGNTRDKAEMKRRVKLGYDGACTDAVALYDNTGLSHFSHTSELLLGAVNVEGKNVLDVGCGTGIASMLAVERRAVRVMAGDIADGMLDLARAKAEERGLGRERLEFRQFDAEALPFPENSFDVVISGVMLEFAPDQQRAVSEMVRVLAPGGQLAVTTHGPGYYWEAIDAAFRSISKLWIVGYRPEVWQRTEREVGGWLKTAGVEQEVCQRVVWRETFASGGEAFDFFLATSSGWWLSPIPPRARPKELARIRDYFARKAVDRITSDVVLATGRKPIQCRGAMGIDGGQLL